MNNRKLREFWIGSSCVHDEELGSKLCSKTPEHIHVREVNPEQEFIDQTKIQVEAAYKLMKENIHKHEPDWKGLCEGMSNKFTPEDYNLKNTGLISCTPGKCVECKDVYSEFRWSPFFCQDCDIKRVAKITKQLDATANHPSYVKGV